MSALRCTSIRAWVLAGLLVSISVVSHAAGLGKLTVLSTLGEPLNAEVDLVAEKTELGSLGAHLGSPDAFERAGLSYSNALRGANVSIEKRSSGEPYVKITSTKPATEPFVDLLVELTWSTGRISREFTALLDPPDVAAERAKQQKAAAAAEVKPAPAPEAPKAEPVTAPPASEPEAPKADLRIPAEPGEPAEAASAEAPMEPMPKPETAAAAPAEPAPAASVDSGTPPPAADAYGPVKRGDTLNKIATANKPADVSLEQMLVLLTRNNPQAFSGKNMNRLKTGKILQLPTADQYATITEADARKEVRLQARDWRAYREQLATAAGNAEPADQAAQQSTSGKVGAPVQDKATPAAGQPQEVLKLSKNEPAAGAADAKAGARVHALEEEVVARDKAVKEANDRVAKLQKQVTDLQALLEMKNKGMADLQKPAATPSTPKPAPAPSTPAAPATAAAPSTPTQEMKPMTPPPATPPPAAPHSEAAPPPSPPAPTTPKPAPVKQPPSMPPAPEPSLMDQVMDQPVYLGAALGVVLIIIILGVRAVKRRRESHSDSEDAGPARAFANTGDAPAAPLAAVGSSPGAEGGSDQVDPVAEAEIFLAYGRDAQAEELLKDALQTSPNRHDVPLKLLQIYANRKDAKSFEKVARDLQQATGGSGPVWDQAVALGYQVDPGNSRYAAGRSGAGAAAIAAAATTASAENVDFNIGGGSDDSTATTTDIDLGDTGSAFERTQIIDPAAEPAHDSTVSIDTTSLPSTMDFDVGHAVAPPSEAPAEDGAKGLDFDIDLNSLSMGPASDETVIEPPGGLDFDMGNLTLDTPSEQQGSGGASVPEIDLSGISLDLGTQTSPTASPTGKDDRWYDVQTKFDLAKAYQEMGDKDGAREILKEVLAEGDAEQKAAAESVLARLDS